MDIGVAAAAAKGAAKDELIIRKANECVATRKSLAGRAMIFDEFWREGELALLFGPPGVGKSVLAMQIAETAARGRGFEGFRSGWLRQKVLYIDLKHSDEQFEMRYSAGEKKYKFSANLYRVCCEWDAGLAGRIRKAIVKSGAHIVIIDDLSAVRQTHDGTRETLPFMRELKRIKDETGVSMLVLSGCEMPRQRHFVSEVELRRSRILCDSTDSVIAMCHRPGTTDANCIFQTRSRNARVQWTTDNAPICRIERSDDDGFLGIAFDERFVTEMPDEERELICAIKAARDAGTTFTAIAEELKISRTRVTRLLKKWTPLLESEQEPIVPENNDAQDQIIPEPDHEDYDSEDYDSKTYERDIGLAPIETKTIPANDAQPAAEPPPKREMDVSQIPFAAGLKRRSVYDLDHCVDKYGDDYWVESYVEGTDKAKIYYRVDRRKNLFRCERTTFGIHRELIGKGPYLPLSLTRDE